MSITLTGDVERVTYENDQTGFRVIQLGIGAGQQRRKLAVVGTFAAIGVGVRVRVTGELVKDARHGEQLRASSLVPLEPNTLVGLERYLGSGVIPGVGPKYARRIVKAFGMNALEVLDHAPLRLREVKGLGGRRVERIAQAWREQRATSNVMLLLRTHGATPSLAGKIMRLYGDRAAHVVTQAPYRLALEVQGVGFRTADSLARSVGIGGDHPERAQAGVLHVLGTLSDRGHVTPPRATVVEQAATLLDVDIAVVETALSALAESKRIVLDDQHVALFRLDAAESTIAERARALSSRSGSILGGLDHAVSEFEKVTRLKLEDGQIAALRAAAESRLVVITGGPGVGKTTIVRALLSVFDKAGLKVALGAPTGRAAKRLAEATGRAAATLHRLLEHEPRSSRFQRNAEAPLAAQVVIVDEASMLDVELGAALLSAVPPCGRLVIVGDADQLPSVGPGAVLRDLIESGAVRTARLSQIFRQQSRSQIVENAHRILGGERPVGARPKQPNADFYVFERADPEVARQYIVKLVTGHIPQHFGLDAMNEVQVLSPTHRGPVGTAALNQALQQALLFPDGTASEPPSAEAGASKRSGALTLRIGDKVMQTKNDYEREVYNGDIGVIVAIDERARSVVVRFEGREVSYTDGSSDALTLAYAISIHKSQGSEYPAVVVPFFSSHFPMLSRNLVYTAVTRATKLCVLVTDTRALRLALAETRREDRWTGLRRRLRALELT